MFLASKASQYVCGELLVVDGVSVSASLAHACVLTLTVHRVGWVGNSDPRSEWYAISHSCNLSLDVSRAHVNAVYSSVTVALASGWARGTASVIRHGCMFDKLPKCTYYDEDNIGPGSVRNSNLLVSLHAFPNVRMSAQCITR